MTSTATRLPRHNGASLLPLPAKAGLLALCTGAFLALCCTGVQAEVYRIIGADGRVTFSDKPPVEGAKPRSSGNVASAAEASASLPFALRQIALRFPVTLYTGTGCGPCGNGRVLLASRGIPFSERTVTTLEDAAALERLSGENTLPFVTIGGQQIRGFSDVEWSQYLDAAGYPKTSQLPAAYRSPPAVPLVAVQKPPAPAAGDSSGTVAVRPQTPVRPAAPARNDNPAGISF